MMAISTDTDPLSPSPNALLPGEQAVARPGESGRGELLDIRDLSFGRDDVPLFQDLQFGLAAGQLLLVEGDNGSGKTTLLRLLCGLLEPWSGEIRWRGNDIRSCYTDYLAALSYVGHANGVKHGLTPLENLAVARDLAAVGGRPDLPAMLRRLGLHRHADTPVQALSAGQRRRLALARLLFGGKPLWILDEPLTSLDAAGRELIKSLFRDHLAQDGGIIMTSHDAFSLDGVATARMRL